MAARIAAPVPLKVLIIGQGRCYDTHEQKNKEDMPVSDKEKMIAEIVKLLEESPEKAARLVLHFLIGYLY